MDSGDCLIAKISLLKPSNHFAVVKAVWSQNAVAFDIVAFQLVDSKADVQNEYSGSVTYESLQRMARELECSIEQLICNWKQSLSNTHDFIYEIADDTFQWFKDNGIRLNYGSVKLTTVYPKYKLCFDFLLASIDVNTRMKRKYDEKCHEIDKVKRNAAKMKKTYDTNVKEQKSAEQVQLTKFVVLLNEKKTKIQQLERTLKKLEDCSQEYNNNIDSCIQVPNQHCDDDDVSNGKQLPKRSRLTANVQTSTTVNLNLVNQQPSTSRFNETNIFDQDTQQFENTEELCSKM